MGDVWAIDPAISTPAPNAGIQRLGGDTQIVAFEPDPATGDILILSRAWLARARRGRPPVSPGPSFERVRVHRRADPGGRRGPVGLGTNRFNDHTLLGSVQGHAEILAETYPGEDLRVVVAWDVRVYEDQRGVYDQGLPNPLLGVTSAEFAR